MAIQQRILLNPMAGSNVSRRINVTNLTPEQLATLKALAKRTEPKQAGKVQTYMYYVR